MEDVNNFATYKVSLPFIDEDLSSRFSRVNSLASPTVQSGMLYIPSYTKLFDVNRNVNVLRPYIDDIKKARKTDDVSEYNGYHVFDYSAKDFDNATKMGYIGNKDIRGNAINTMNTKLINYSLIDTFVAEPKILVKLPTCESKAIIDYLYIMSSLFQSTQLIKHEKDYWFQDSFILLCHSPIKPKINSIRKVSTEMLTKRTNMNPSNILASIPHSMPVSSFLSFDVDHQEFISAYLDFHKYLCLKVYSYLSRLLMSSQTKSINNPHQEILKANYF
jgi:hypothetical protein